MYSVEDLLISHGYKLPRNAPPSSSSSSSCEAAGRPPPAKSCPVPPGGGRAPGASVCGDGSQGDGNHGDTRQQRARPGALHSSSDSGFYNGTRDLYSHQQREAESEEREMLYWRRRGQDFSLLLDYADGRELRAAVGGLGRAERARRAPVPEERRAGRQRWDESAWLRVRDAAQGQWRGMGAPAGDRKCQSLGTEEWRPALGLGRHLSDGEGKLWAQEQAYRLPAEGAVHPKTKGKSQSLPRVLTPESLQQANTPLSLLDGYPGHRFNGSTSHVPHARHRYPPYHHHYHRNSNVAGSRDPWMESSSSSRLSHHMALLPKPRFSRPLKPPSYEDHQQTRGSAETLAEDQVPKTRDGPAAGSSEGGEPMGREYFAHDSAEPPGYIPPPSYKRPFLYRGGQRSGEGLNHQFQVEEQIPGSTELGRWYSRRVGSSWQERHKDRSAPCREPAFPGRSEEEAAEEKLGSVQYLPFDDPRVRHISGGSCENSLDDSEKIGSVDKEVPSANVLGQSTLDSAFLPPQELIVLNTDTSKTSLSEQDGGNRQHSNLHKGSDDSTVSESLSDIKSSECPKAFLVKPIWQNRNPDRAVFPETVTQVKKIEPGGAETEKSKRKLTETIFCLVSIPIHSQSVGDDSEQAELQQPAPLVQGPDETGSDHLQNQSLRSTSSTDLELQALTGSMRSNKGPKKHPSLGKEVQSLNPVHDLSSGSWPGDQYRDQETQTCSPEVTKAPPPGPTDQQAQDQPRSASDTTTDSGVGTDCSNRYGYPMKGQKNLNQSSNSAFSRTCNFSSSSGPLHKSTAQSPPQPSGNQEEPDYLPAQKGQNQSRGKPPAAGPGPEAFGQFLLKPISRRPWDAIEELESFNKELQQQIIKGSSVDQCIEDLDEAYRDILELETVSNNIIEPVPSPDHTKSDPDPAPLGEPLGRAGKARHTLEGWTAAADPAYREVKSAFSRPAGKSVSFCFSKPPREEAPAAPSEIGFREYTSIASQITDKPAGCHCSNASLDAFAPKESGHRDEPDQPEHTPVEVPWAARQPMQDASTLTSPPDYEDVCHALQLTREPAVGVSRGVTAKLGGTSVTAKLTGTSSATLPPTSSFKVVTFAACSQQDGPLSQAEALRQMKRNSLPRFRGERSLNVLMVKGQRDRFRGRGASRCIVVKDTDGTAVASSSSSSSSSEDDETNKDADKCFDSRKQQAIIKKHQEALLTNERSDSSTPVEDLSNLCEVKCAQGIPENESIEERAARILGINVPAACLGVVEQKGEERVSESEKGSAAVERKHFPLIATPKMVGAERIPHVLWRRRKELDIDSLALELRGKQAGGAVEHGGDGLDRKGAENHLGSCPAFPEFPAERLRLSVALDRRGGRGRGRGPSRVIEALQDKLTAPSCRAAAERLARMREVDSVSRMRRLSARSSDSGEEPEEGGGAGYGGGMGYGGGAGYSAALSTDRPLSLPLPLPLSLSHTANPEFHCATISRREISLPLGLCAPSSRTGPQDEGPLSLPDHYDPSRVEQV